MRTHTAQSRWGCTCVPSARVPPLHTHARAHMHLRTLPLKPVPNAPPCKHKQKHTHTTAHTAHTRACVCTFVAHAPSLAHPRGIASSPPETNPLQGHTNSRRHTHSTRMHSLQSLHALVDGVAALEGQHIGVLGQGGAHLRRGGAGENTLWLLKALHARHVYTCVCVRARVL